MSKKWTALHDMLTFEMKDVRGRQTRDKRCFVIWIGENLFQKKRQLAVAELDVSWLRVDLITRSVTNFIQQLGQTLADSDTRKAVVNRQKVPLTEQWREGRF